MAEQYEGKAFLRLAIFVTVKSMSGPINQSVPIIPGQIEQLIPWNLYHNNSTSSRKEGMSIPGASYVGGYRKSKYHRLLKCLFGALSVGLWPVPS